MEEDRQTLLNEITGSLDRLLKGELPRPVNCSGSEDAGLIQVCEKVNLLIEVFTESSDFLQALAAGRLDVEPPPRNFLVSPFKQMQSNLRHLTWQTQQIARGDYDQHVNFLGEFSTSFNAMIGFLRDKRRVEEALAASEKRLRDITSALGEGVYVLGFDGSLVFMNPAAEKMLGWNEKELRGRKVHETIHYRKPDGSPFPADECPAFDTLKTGKSYTIPDDEFINRDGLRIPVSYISTPLIDNGKISGSVVAFHNIASLRLSREALERANELLEREASQDALTGIANRRKFNDAIDVEIARARRHQMSLSVIMFEIDDFKKVNDRLGREAGDLLLVELTRLIASLLRDGDVFARWGGEEFVVLMPQTGLEAGVKLAERLRRAIGQTAFETVGRITCSFGVAEFEPADDAGALMRRVDRSLYAAQGGGKNRFAAV